MYIVYLEALFPKTQCNRRDRQRLRSTFILIRVLTSIIMPHQIMGIQNSFNNTFEIRSSASKSLSRKVQMGDQVQVDPLSCHFQMGFGDSSLRIKVVQIASREHVCHAVDPSPHLRPPFLFLLWTILEQ